MPMSSHRISPEPAPTVDAVALLPLPDWVDLSDHQARGAACVWCAATLDTRTAVDLGQRRMELADGFISVFPRSCRKDVADRAYKVLLDHGQSCEQCADDASQCATGSALWRLVREARR